MKPRLRTTKAAMDEYKSSNKARILASHLVKSGESFTVADTVEWLSKAINERLAHGIVAGYLTELMEEGHLSRRPNRPGNKSGSLIYTKKGSNALRLRWRVTTDGQIGLAKSDRLGAA